jgi:hypothetical protein
MPFNYLSTARKSKRSQSALEYMMTYGWAILIIVIVAVILYSMGIFNPSSSITTTSIGFSPFTVSSTVCSPAGLSVAIIGGGLPDTATQATITKIYITSNTGTTALTKEYNLTKTEISPGKTATIIIPTVACTSAGVKYSLSAKIQYSYSTPAGAVITNTTGTIAGTSSVNPIVKYVPLTITSSTATPSPFQQMVIVNMNNYNSYASSNLSNIEFTYPNGTIIPSWRENGTSNSQTVLYWLKLGSFTTTTVYMDFFSTSSNVLNTVNTGEAPQLSSTYAEYDDGANVFLNYYSGASDSGWVTSGTAGQTTSAPSGSPFGTDALYALNSGGNYLYTVASGQSTNMIIEYYTYINRLNDVFFLENPSGAGQFARQGDSGGWYGIAATASWTSWSTAPDTGSWSGEWVLSGVMVVNGVATQYLSTTLGNYGSELGQNPSNTYTVSNNGNYLGLVGDSGGSADEYWNGLIIRAYPPSGVMPSISFGSVA